VSKQRLEAFSDGIIAIIITVMVLELHVPQGTEWSALRPVVPALLSYVLSFVFVAIYWNNHHHLFQAVQLVNGKILWANLHLLFWLSLVPFVTRWMGESPLAPGPVTAYGAVLLLAAIAYYILARALIGLHGQASSLARALGSDVKGKASLFLYVVALAVAPLRAPVACAIYVLVAVIWLVPDRRIEAVLERQVPLGSERDGQAG
jgi:uncharacterized membrane protein